MCFFSIFLMKLLKYAVCLGNMLPFLNLMITCVWIFMYVQAYYILPYIKSLPQADLCHFLNGQIIIGTLLKQLWILYIYSMIKENN